MCCEFPAKVYVCGGKGCSLVKDFFGSIGMFCRALVRPFSGTSAKDVFTLSKGNPIAALQAIMVLLFYFGVVYALGQVILVLTGSLALAGPSSQNQQPQQQIQQPQQQFQQPFQQPQQQFQQPQWTAQQPQMQMQIGGQAEMQQLMTTYAVAMSIILLIGMCIGSYCSWFGSVKRRGCTCSYFFCVEGYFILYLLSCQACLTVVFSLTAIVSYIKIGSTASIILGLTMLPFCFLNIYSGVYLFRAAGLTDEEHDKDLESMSDSDSES